MGDTNRKWLKAKIVTKSDSSMKVHFLGWSAEDDETILADKEWITRLVYANCETIELRRLSPSSNYVAQMTVEKDTVWSAWSEEVTIEAWKTGQYVDARDCYRHIVYCMRK